ncbi:MAG: TIGR03960 family B12-binding radical SAM protein [Clostridiales bacterium]|nr:TIGR03960 family B12-binding radical SAM protein [Clostridiales bacterium]
MITLKDKILSSVTKPTRYTGGELNSVIKDPADVYVRFGFCFPDVYEIAMSHLGMKILYHTLNTREDTYCERVFAPWPDMEEQMQKHGMKLFALETGDEVTHFDMLGFTMQYELSYSNIVNMLMLADIPIKASERGEDFPIICGGGSCSYNAEPVADIFDFFTMGEGEEVMHEVVSEYAKWKRSGKKCKRDYLEAIAKIDGVYVPSFYDVKYNEDNTVKSVTPNNPNAREVITKRIMADFDSAYTPHELMVPFGEIVHDRVVLEIMRGCLRGCRFCQAGYIYRPLRERKSDTLLVLADDLLSCSGYDEISLSSLSTSDFGGLKELTDGLLDMTEEKKIGLSLPSLRIDNFSLELMHKVQAVRKSGITFAPEAGTQRLRDVINKNITEEDIMRSTRRLFEGGWTNVKLYFMIGLPTETEEDVKGIADLSQRVLDVYFSIPKEERAKNINITVSTSSFVPKPFTAFQWCPMDSREQLIKKQDLLKSSIKTRRIKYSWHDNKTSYLEGIFARGDRRLCDVIIRAVELGCKFDGWNEYFRFDLWMQAFEELGIDPDFYTARERSIDEVLPWDHIDVGVTKQFLISEYEKSKLAQTTPHCRQKCSNCGAARFKTGVCLEKREAQKNE